MSGWLILLVSAIYVCVAVEELRKGHAALAIVFAGYALSNEGLWFASKSL